MATKKEIVKMILKEDLEDASESDLIELLIDNPVAVDVDKVEDENMTRADKFADLIAEKVGSWKFIICFSIFLFLWMAINTIFLSSGFDPFPFILLNLILSCVSALQAPIIMMSQNRQAKKDRRRNHNDYMVDLKSELILETLHAEINEVLRNQKKILKHLEKKK